MFWNVLHIFMPSKLTSVVSTFYRVLSLFSKIQKPRPESAALFDERGVLPRQVVFLLISQSWVVRQGLEGLGQVPHTPAVVR